MLLPAWKRQIEQAAAEGYELRQGYNGAAVYCFFGVKPNSEELVIADNLMPRQVIAFGPEIQQYFDECKGAK